MSLSHWLAISSIGSTFKNEISLILLLLLWFHDGLTFFDSPHGTVFSLFNPCLAIENIYILSLMLCSGLQIQPFQIW